MAYAPGDAFLGRQELLTLPTPESTATHSVVPHHQVVAALIESLHFRHLDVVSDQYAISKDAQKIFGVLEINDGTDEVRFNIGLRNSNDRSFALGLCVGYRVFVCSNLSFHGDFTPVTRRHSKNFDYVEVIDAAVGKMQRHFGPMRRDIDVWKNHGLPDDRAKGIIYDAFIGERLDAPKHIARLVDQAYFAPAHEEFQARNLWSLSNAFTEAFKTLDPVPQMRAIASLAPFLQTYH